jgi:hypothetical protein
MDSTRTEGEASSRDAKTQPTRQQNQSVAATAMEEMTPQSASAPEQGGVLSVPHQPLHYYGYQGYGMPHPMAMMNPPQHHNFMMQHSPPGYNPRLPPMAYVPLSRMGYSPAHQQQIVLQGVNHSNPEQFMSDGGMALHPASVPRHEYPAPAVAANTAGTPSLEQQPNMPPSSRVTPVVRIPPEQALEHATPEQREWVNDILHRDWEIFWKQESCTRKVVVNLVDSDGDESSTDHEDDWYDGKIQSLHHGTKSGNEEAISLHFDIVFVGDEQMYEMVLTAKDVRPSARTWIRRTQAILQQPLVEQYDGVDNPENRSKWFDSIPSDTSTRSDQAELHSIRVRAEEEYPVVKSAKFFDDGEDSSKIFQRLRLQHEECCQLMTLVRSQLYLRTKLARIEPLDDADDNGFPLDPEEEEPDPAEPYVEFLTKCLQGLEHACQWHFKCWMMFFRIFSIDRLDDEELSCDISRTVIIDDCLGGGRSFLASLLSDSDISLKAARSKSKGRKRSAPDSLVPVVKIESPLSPTRSHSARQRAKRRRRSQNFSEKSLDPGAALNGEDEEDMLATELIVAFVDRVCTTDQRWFTGHMGDMLRSFSIMIVARYIRWERRAMFYLGERETLDVLSSDGETTGEASDDRDDSCDADKRCSPARDGISRIRERRYVKYEDIEAIIESAGNDRLLKCFELSAHVKPLREKLTAIDAFEKRAWELIGSVLSETVNVVEGTSSPWDPDSDAVQSRLRQLLRDAQTKDGPIENIKPIGRSSSSLSREVIENAMVYRAWFVHLKYAESVRERVAYLDSVVSTLNKLPTLPVRVGSSNQDISDELSKVTPRVQALSARCLHHAALFNKYQSMLTDRAMPKHLNERKGFHTLDAVSKALEELQQGPVISAAEEMLAIRYDTLCWEQKAQAVLRKEVPRFDEVFELKVIAGEILDARCKTRAAIKKDKKPSAAVESEMKAFSHAEIQHLCGELYSGMLEIFAISSAWKERANCVFLTLRGFGNALAGNIGLGSVKPASMVDLKRINDLIDEYETLKVDLSEDKEMLVRVRDAAILWSASVSVQLQNDDNSFDVLLDVVEKTSRERPPGIIIDPTRCAIESLGEILQWYLDWKKFLRSDSCDVASVTSFLVVGLPVLTLYCKTNKTAMPVPEDSRAMLMSRNDVRKTTRPIAVDKIASNNLSNAVLERIIDSSRDVREGSPILRLYFYLMAYHADDLARKCLSLGNGGPEVSLSRARALCSALPSAFEGNILEKRLPGFLITHFLKLVDEAQQKEDHAQNILSLSKKYLRQTADRSEEIEMHLNDLKDLQLDCKSRRVSTGKLLLDIELEQRLEDDVKLFSWLLKTYAYPFLLSDKVKQNNVANEDTRIPYEILVRLHNQIPNSNVTLGDFACIVLRVKEFYKAATEWKDDISKLTRLTPRGIERRSRAASGDDSDEGTKIDSGKIKALSNNPILSKVRIVLRTKNSCYLFWY